MAGIFLYLKHVAGLLDRCYEREALLHANHIHSFAPILQFDEQLADTAQELAEYREFVRNDTEAISGRTLMLPPQLRE